MSREKSQENISAHARALSIIGAQKGGKARAEKLTSEQRQEIARQAAEARWEREDAQKGIVIPRATHIGELVIGDSTIKCAVLEDGIRVLTRATFVKAMGRTGKAKGGRGYDDEFRTPVFLTAKNLRPFIPDGILENSTPIIFKLSGQRVIGYKAELLPQVCGVFIDAERAGVLTLNQIPIAKKCNILLRGFATVGIIALVDEATGYQEVRDRQALEKILERYIRGELGKWAKTFPDEFYKEMFRLRGWQYSPLSVKRPQYIGHLTNDIVYARLAPGVLDELRRREPKDDRGRRRHKFFQWLTDDIGHPRLREHLVATLALMRVSSGWDEFNRMLQRAFPKINTNLGLPLDESKKISVK
jgi:hypothetical protein